MAKKADKMDKKGIRPSRSSKMLTRAELKARCKKTGLDWRAEALRQALGMSKKDFYEAPFNPKIPGVRDPEDFERGARAYEKATGRKAAR